MVKAYIFIIITLVVFSTFSGSMSRVLLEGSESTNNHTPNILVFKAIGEECKSSFQCASACCTGSACKDIEDCNSILSTAYIISCIAAAVVIIFSVIYLVFELRKTRANVVEIKRKIEESKNEVKQRLSAIQEGKAN